ncbi:MAG: hypothetical protein J3K34DRAFT_516896 [Monoraphidium minutum]|nr:MAG: hypothetical protein J3K34DRAFT_516896 [Monoraphidium minutum]
MASSATGTAQDADELRIPLLSSEQAGEEEIVSAPGAGSQEEEEHHDIETGAQESSPAASSAPQEAPADESWVQAANPGGAPVVLYLVDLLRLLIFYWALAADVLLLRELYTHDLFGEAAAATAATVAHHVLMSLLLIVRQGWLAAAAQACGFILTLNPFESLRPIPDGLLGLVIISVGFVAYVVIAASGLIFVAYCVICYLVTALLFSLLILDLAALVLTVAPAKGIFKYTDLVYTENFKFSRLALQAALQSVPQLALIGWLVYRGAGGGGGGTAGGGGPYDTIDTAILVQTLVAHLVNAWDKALMFRGAAAAAGSGPARHAWLALALKGSARVARPVLEENLNRAPVGAGHGVHISSSEEPEDSTSDVAASMVPEYLTPLNGGLLSPGQMAGVMRALCARLASPEVWELELDLSPDQLPGRLLADAAAAFPNVIGVRISNAHIGGADAALLSRALLSLPALARVQLQGCAADARGCAALARLLAATSTLAQLDMTTCKLPGSCRPPRCCGGGGAGGGARACCGGACLPLALCCGRGERERRKACAALARGLKDNRTLRQLNLAGTDLGEAGGVAVAEALRCSKALQYVNLAFCQLGAAAAEALGQALLATCQLRVLAVSLSELPPAGARALASAARRLAPPPKQPPSLEVHMQVGAARVQGIDALEILLVEDEPTLITDTWNGITGGPSFEPARAPPPPPPSPPPGGPAAAAGAAPSCSPCGGAGGADGGADGGAGPHAAGGGAPRLALVVLQEAAAGCLARLPAMLGDMDTLDLSGLGLGNAGANDIAETLAADPPLRRLVLADNAVGMEGAAALAAALRTNDALQELDISSNEFDDAAAGALADAARGARGLRRLVLLGNKTPFSLSTLRLLMEAEASSGGVSLVLVEDPREVLERLRGGRGEGGRDAGSGGAAAAPEYTRVVEFYQRQEQQRAARRARRQARQQRAAAKAAAAAAAAAGRAQRQAAAARKAGAAWLPLAAGEGGAVAGSGGSDGAASAAAAAAAVPGRPSSPFAVEAPHGPAPDAAAAAAAGELERRASGGSGGGASGSGSGSGPPSTQADEDTCGVCFDNEDHVAIKYCGHRLCVSCYRRVWELSGGAATCPFCRAPLEGYGYLDWPLELHD